MNNIKMIGIGCTALVGKDKLFSILNSLFPDRLERIGLADELKCEMDEFCRKNYGISAFTKDPEEKTLIRPIFVAHGKVKRTQHQGKYWTGLVQPRVDSLMASGIIPVCTDIRYSTYPEDEIFWLKNKNNGVYIHVNRYNKDGSKVLAANSDELEQEKILSEYADFRLNWTTSSNQEFLIDTVEKQLDDLLSKIRNQYGIK